MTQGRQFRWTLLGLGCVVAAVFAIAPASAGAQGAIDEYELGDLPSADGDNTAQASGASGDEGDPATGATDPATEQIEPIGDDDSGEGSGDATGAAGGSSGGGGSADPAKGGAKPADRGADRVDSIPAATTSSASDDGGAPVALIALAALTAIAAGLAVWRLRRGGGDGSGLEPAESTGGGSSA